MTMNVWPTLMELGERLVKLRNSFRAQKGGLGNITATTEEEKAWLEWARDNSDKFREELNELIELFDKIIGWNCCIVPKENKLLELTKSMYKTSNIEALCREYRA